MARGVIILVIAVEMILVSSKLGTVKGDVGQDTAECADQLSSMATCLQYVQGEAKAPTPDCCTGLKQVLSSSKKCLCVIVKDGNDPQLGLNINVTLALGLPSVCHATANVTQCPALLHLDPNSAEAQIFYDFGKTSSTPTASSPGPAPEPVAGGGSGSSSTASAPQKGNACRAGQGRGWSSSVAFVWFFIICSNLLLP